MRSIELLLELVITMFTVWIRHIVQTNERRVAG